MGRFINKDTYEGDISNPLSLNLYTYVYNNPLIYTDPSGNCALCFTAAAGAIIGGAISGVSTYVSSGGNWKRTWAGVVGGAVSGALAGSGIGLISGSVVAMGVTGAAIGSGSSIAGNYVQQGLTNKWEGNMSLADSFAMNNISEASLILNGATGAFAGAVGGVVKFNTDIMKTTRDLWMRGQMVIDGQYSRVVSRYADDFYGAMVNYYDYTYNTLASIDSELLNNMPDLQAFIEMYYDDIASYISELNSYITN